MQWIKQYLRNNLKISFLIFSSMKSRSGVSDLSDLAKHERQSLVTRSISSIKRISGDKSPYSLDVERILTRLPLIHLHLTSIIGIVQALYDDLKSGYIESLTELVHAEVFSDFIEMADHLVATGYKDPAAVIAGSTLESHLKKIAVKNGLPIETNGRPTRAEQINQDLGKQQTYSLIDQKSITAWLDLRNKAAHGNYNEYNIDQVKLLISGIQNFIMRNPA